MALIVEDGTALADAESYISVADATAYHAARGNSAWAALASDTVREQALRKAADYLGETYRDRWTGYRVTTTQALDWPRYGAPRRDLPSDGYHVQYASDVIPAEVVRACAELAIRAAAGDLTEDEEQRIAAVSAGSVSVTFQAGSSPRKKFPAVDGLLRPLLKANGGIAVARA